MQIVRDGFQRMERATQSDATLASGLPIDVKMDSQVVWECIIGQLIRPLQQRSFDFPQSFASLTLCLQSSCSVYNLHKSVCAIRMIDDALKLTAWPCQQQPPQLNGAYGSACVRSGCTGKQAVFSLFSSKRAAARERWTFSHLTRIWVLPPTNSSNACITCSLCFVFLKFVLHVPSDFCTQKKKTYRGHGSVPVRSRPGLFFFPLTSCFDTSGLSFADNAFKYE